MYVNGTKVGANYTDSTNYGATKPLTYGAQFDGAQPMTGWIGPIRITKGVARYTDDATITVPTLPLLSS